MPVILPFPHPVAHTSPTLGLFIRLSSHFVLFHFCNFVLAVPFSLTDISYFSTYQTDIISKHKF